MDEKHSFGNPVRCVDCGQLVGAVWSPLWLLAQGGEGRCDACQEKYIGKLQADAKAIAVAALRAQIAAPEEATWADEADRLTPSEPAPRRPAGKRG